jgi:hypothetical protein
MTDNVVKFPDAPPTCAEAMSKLNPEGFPSSEALTAWVNVAANRWRLHPEPISIAELFPFIEKHGGRDD